MKKLIAEYRGYGASVATKEEADNLSAKIYVYISTYIILITNL